jgi:two-component sensor histidine kinase
MSLVKASHGPRTWLVSFVTLAVLAGLGLWTAALWQSYRASLNKARNNIGFASWLAEEHVRGAVRGIDVILQGVVDEVENGGLQAAVADEKVRTRLRHGAQTLPHLGDILIFDQSGALTFSTSVLPPQTTIADGAVLRALHDDGKALFLTSWKSPTTGQFLVGVARRLAQDGTFHGVVLGALDFSFFERFVQSLSLPPGSAVAVYSSDARLILRQPVAGEDLAENYGDLPLFSQQDSVKGPAGLYEGTDPQTGREEIYAYRRLQDLPLIVQVSTPKAANLRDWWFFVFASSGFALGGLAITVLLTGAAVRSIRLLEEARAREAATNVSLAATVAQQEMLFREMHHRTKNNLQMIASLVALQARREPDPAVRQRLQETIGRVTSMAAIHQQMQGSDNLTGADCSAYLAAVCDSLRLTADRDTIVIETALEPVRCSMADAVALGQIVNEAVTNSLKHAFPDGRAGRIEVALRHRPDGRLVLTVSDNGVGMPAVAPDSNSLGLLVIRSMVLKLEAELDWRSSDQGTELEVVLPAKTEEPASGLVGGAKAAPQSPQ